MKTGLWTYFCLFAGLAWLVGCGGRGDLPELGLVTGTVRMDDEPIPQVRVTFGPTSGRSSKAITDDQGRYELRYLDKTKGAKVGSHKVAITTYYEDEDSPEALRAKEIIPPRYNSKTELTAEVKPGRNVIDFPLTSK